MSRTIVYILGSPRSGTTALEYVLSTHPLCHAVGETMLLQKFILNDPSLVLSKGRCTCGVLLPLCPFWQDVIATSAQRIGILPTELRTLTSEFHVETAPSSTLNTHLCVLMETIASKTNAIIIDSSKNLAYLHALMQALPNWNFRIIHMLREPLEVARSQNKWRAATGKKKLPETYLIIRWLQANFSTTVKLRNSFPDKAFQLTYERLVTQNDATLKDLSEFLNLPLLFRTTTNLRTLHTVSGTPTRFNHDHFALSLEPHKNASSHLSLFSTYLSRFALRACIPRNMALLTAAHNSSPTA